MTNKLEPLDNETVNQYTEINFSILAEKSLVGIYLIQDGVYKYINPKFAEIFEYTTEELINKLGPKDLTFPDDLIKVENNIKSRIKGDIKSVNYEFRGITKNNKIKFIEVFGSRASYNNKPAILGTLLDVTERKNAVDEIKKSEKKYKELAEMLPQMIFEIDSTGKITYANKNIIEKIGYSSEEIEKGISSLQIITASERERAADDISEILNGKTLYNRVYTILRKDGFSFPAEISASPIYSENRIIGLRGFIIDETESKRNEMELKTAKEKAEEMSRMKSIFLANMSHELRTPMTGIMGYAETLYNELKESPLKDMAETLLKSSSRLKETLNLILDLSRVEANKIEINSTNLNIPEILGEIVKLFEIAAIEKNLKLELIIKDENLSSMLDKRMFVQIIENLINNAIKYTNIGKVAITAGKKIEKGKAFSVIEIKDTGIGIQSENIDVIFEPFRQISEGNTRNFEGTGLGLTITKKFVELLGGNIYVVSKLGAGTKFTVIFPSVEVNLADKDNKDIEKKENKMDEKKGNYSLLLVENDIPSIDIIKIYLQEKYTVDYALDGLTALQMVEKKNYDAILMDIDLGFGMNGLEVTQKIKELKDYKNVPIIAVTAYAMLGDREKFLSAGCTHYIAKPFDKLALVDLMESIF